MPVALARKATYLLGKDWLQSAAEEITFVDCGRKEPLFAGGRIIPANLPHQGIRCLLT